MLFIAPVIFEELCSLESGRQLRNIGHWFIVGSSNEVRKKPVAKKRFGMPLVFWRDHEGKLICMPDKCPHRGAALSFGKIVNDCIVCPYHSFGFSAEGACTSIPTDTAVSASRLSVKTYPVAESNGWIWLWRGEDSPNLPRPPTLGELSEYKRYSETQVSWPTHHTRAMEALIDLSHVPTVHSKTLARVTAPSPFDNIKLEERADGFKAYNEEDPTGNYFIIKYPNLWLNWCLPDIFVVQAPVCVDDQQTIIYSRTYFRKPILPLTSLLKLGYMLGSKHILRQDMRVVKTQQPANVDDVTSERLLPSDKPVLAYRRLRRRAMMTKEIDEASSEEHSEIFS